MVIPKHYIPRRGDLIWLNFELQTGKEQKGRRPAVVLSNSSYNQIVGLVICCPVTSKIKGYPFEVLLPSNLPISGVVLADQIKSLDWKKREAQFIGELNDSLLEKILGLFIKIIGK
ncbi:MAG: endoribonuclease MazF [Prolixibacteraceae bacterium]|nr:endoribonuclease MazF [Prolixibacteraceae bacterium]